MNTLENMLLVVWMMKWWIVGAVVVFVLLMIFFGNEEEEAHELSWWKDPDHDGESSEGWKCSCEAWGYDITSAQVHLMAAIQREKMT